MKSNLDTLFKTDGKMENDGIWFLLDDERGFLLRRFGGANSTQVKAMLNRHYKPLARQVQAGTLGQAKEEEIMTKVFVEACLVDWKGISIDDAPAPFSKEAAVKLLVSLPELSKSLQDYASDYNNFKIELGNG